MFRRLKKLVRGTPSQPAAAPAPRPAAAVRPPPRPEPVRAGPPSPDEPHQLALYKYDACPYCRRVQQALEEMPEVGVVMRDTRKDRTAAQELMEKTGRSTVPCLFIDGEPLFESLDILAWLAAYQKGGAQA